MKKIDLHLHTISTISDYDFTFDIQTLQKYVSDLNIDCIAITNHNVFNLAQYNEIVEALDITVFPGIEIDLESGHLLLINDHCELHYFSQKCSQVTSQITTKDDCITVERLNEIFPDLSKYLLIPHYGKKPTIKEETLEKLRRNISSGEVTSAKKFKYCLKDDESLVPVLFSDLRMKSGMSKFPTRQTYVDIGEISLSALKNALTDKNKVFLSSEEGHHFFDALDNGLRLSTGLNVLLGERSTGKSHTLNRLSQEYESIKYIKQFSLLERDQESDIRKFNDSLSRRQSILTRDYLNKIQTAVDDVLDIDLEKDERSIEDYLSSLIKNAKESEKADSYSKAKLFNESNFTIGDESNIKSLVDATVKLIENTEYREIIDQHLSMRSLKGLAINLMKKYTKETSARLKKQYINDIVDSIKGELRVHTAATPITDLDLYQISLDRAKVEKFKEVINAAKNEKEIFRKEIQGYMIVAKRRAFEGAQELKNLSGKMLSFSSAFNVYADSYEFIKSLSQISGLEETDYYKYFVKIEYEILNRYGYKVSGGERSEFRLLQEINDAQQYDMLLIDEPESSFDNVFLMNKVNSLIKEISTNMPVVLVTHNSTVGASIKPDYVLCTKKHLVDGDIVYSIYSGHPTDKELRGLNGDTIHNHEALLNCLEAGEAAYSERGNSYEIIKN